MRYYLFLAISILLLVFSHCKSSDISQESEIKAIPLDSLWQEYERYSSKQRPESAEKILESIISNAEIQNNAPDLVKAIWLNYQSISRKEGGTEGIDYLKGTIHNKDERLLPLLHYMNALAYFHYYNSNQWEINSRTSYASSRDEPVSEWGQRQFLETIHEHLFKAVDSSLLEETTHDWKAVLEELDSSMVDYRPVLYDVMVPEVAELLSLSEMQLLPLAEMGWLKEPALLKDRESFLQLKILDTLNQLDEAVSFYQQWFERRINEKDILAHADLSRLQFFHAHSRHPQKDQLFLRALKGFDDSYEDPYALANALYLQAQLYQSWQGKSVGDGMNAYQMAIRAVAELQAQYPQSPYVKAAEQIAHQIQQPVLSVALEDVNLPNQPMLVSLKTKNLDQFTLEAYKIEYEQLDELRKTHSKPFVDFIQKLELVAEKEYPLPKRNDYELYTYEVGFPGLSTGLYVFVARAGESVHWRSIEVSDLATYTMEGNKVMVVDRINGKAIENAKVTIEERDWRRSSSNFSSFYTQVDGIASIDIKGRKNLIIQKVEKGDRTHYPQLNVYRSYTQSEIDHRSRIHLLTDRSIYRPGQTVYYKGIVYRMKSRSDWNIEENKSVEVQLRDQNGQTIGKTESTSNAWGSIEGFFQIPDDVLTGNMMIHTPFGQSQIKVEEYKRPTFTVELEIQKAQKYTLGDSVLMNGVAETLNGVAIGNAEVSYTVRRQYYTPWYYSYFPSMNDQQVEISSGNLRSDKEGAFSIQFLAMADTSFHHAHFMVTVEVTDVGGETHMAEKRLSLSHKPFQIVGDVSKRVTPETLKSTEFKAINNFGDTLRETVQVRLSKVRGPEAGKIDRYWVFPDSILMSEKEFITSFENYAYEDRSHPAKWEIQSSVGSQEIVFDGTRTLPEEWVSNISKGWYQLQFNDLEGKEINSFYFELIDIEHTPSSTEPSLQLIEPARSISVGQEEEIKFIKPFDDSRVYTAIYYPESPNQLNWISKNNLKISPKEGDRGGVDIRLVCVQKNRIYTEYQRIRVPWTNKELNIKAKTFREVLKPGVEEKWAFTVSEDNAELAAVLYDASLDEIYQHRWSRVSFPDFSIYTHISHNGFHAVNLRTAIGFERNYSSVHLPEYPSFIFSLHRTPVYYRMIDPETYEENIAVQRDAMAEGANAIMIKGDQAGVEVQEAEAKTDLRENLNETVFFHPQIQGDKGSFEIEFTMGEALTAWNLFLFAHTKDMKTGVKELQVKTHKELMIKPLLPRFLRSGDSIQIVGRIQNQTSKDQEVEARVVLKDAINGRVINAKFEIHEDRKSVLIPSGGSQAVHWSIFVPEAEEVAAVRVEMYAATEKWTDGEANILPVVSNRILLTEARPLEVGANSAASFNLQEWSRQWLDSESARPLEYGLEFTQQPLWYAVQALPYLSGSEYDCSEQLINRLYANALASKIAEEIPNLTAILNQMKKEGQLKSPLYQDEKWKSVDLNATPWLKEAISETQRMANINLLLNRQNREYEQKIILRKLQQWQNADGGFPWFKGGRSNAYITQYICVQILRMHRMHLIPKDLTTNVLDRAIQFCDREFMQWYKEYGLEHENTGLSQVYYYYLKSLQGELPGSDAWKTIDSLLKENWTLAGLYNQALLARSWQLQSNTDMSGTLLNSFQERALKDSVIGAYWNQAGLRRTYVDDIELHALMIEVFESSGDSDFSNRLKTWLIKNKQTNHWTNTKSTAAAIHALLLRGSSGLEDEGFVEIRADGAKIPWTSSSVIDEWHQSFEQTVDAPSDFPFEIVTVSNERKHPVWGAAYIQYSERMGDVQKGEQHGLTIQKKYFKEVWTVTGNQLIPLGNEEVLKPGDILVARIIVSVDRSMDFVHLKSERASSLEPLSQISGYTYRDGIGYYESIKDLATHFFIDHLPKGTFVFEHRERVVLKGSCLGGLSQVESMYAPEFRAHTSGKIIITEEK